MSGARILIVEDEARLLTGLTESFERKGYQVLSAQDGAAGLELAASALPDVLLLDLMLPRMNGFEVCRAVKQTPTGLLPAQFGQPGVVLLPDAVPAQLGLALEQSVAPLPRIVIEQAVRPAVEE